MTRPAGQRSGRTSIALKAGGLLLLVAALVAAAIWRIGGVGTSNSLIREAALAYDRGEIDKAGSLARQQLKATADDPLALRMAARVAARQGRDEAATGLFSRLAVADLEPLDFSLLGRSLARSGKAEPAIKALETALEGRPDDPEILDTLAELDIQNDRHFAAEKVAERLAAITSHAARGNLLLGTAREQLNDPSGASDALRRCFKLDPELKSAGRNSVEPFRLLFIRALLKSGQAAEAREFIGTIAGTAPSGEQNWLLSRAYIQEGNWARATESLRADPSYRIQHSLESEPAPFVGSARCAECHRDSSREVLASRHATTFADSHDLASLTLPAAAVADPGNATVLHTLDRQDGQIRFQTQTRDQIYRAVARYAFGSLDHFASLVGPDQEGVTRMLRMSHFDSPRGAGWDLTTNLPLIPSEPDQYLGKKMDGNDGLRRCLSCHTTNFRAVLDRRGPEAADRSIGCEACHGPGSHHVAAVGAGFPDPAIAAPRDASALEINTLCGRCHTMHQSQAVSAPRTDPLWIRFPSLTLAWSRCFTEGNGRLSCLTCHNPHQNADTSVARNEARCLGCHASAATSTSSTTKNSPIHLATSPTTTSAFPTATPCPVNRTNGCLNCHMPKTWDEKTHSFKSDHFIRIR